MILLTLFLKLKNKVTTGFRFFEFFFFVYAVIIFHEICSKEKLFNVFVNVQSKYSKVDLCKKVFGGFLIGTVLTSEYISTISNKLFKKMHLIAKKGHEEELKLIISYCGEDVLKRICHFSETHFDNNNSGENVFFLKEQANGTFRYTCSSLPKWITLQTIVNIILMGMSIELFR